MESTLAYSQSQFDLVLAAFVMALFALFGTFVYLLATRSEISPRFRPSGMAGAVICLIAAMAYLLLTASWLTGFDFDPGSKTLSSSDSVLQFRNGYRYVDWVVTVPLLAVELIAISALSGLRASRTRVIAMALAVGMVVTGFLGEDTFRSDGGRLLWGLISTAFFIPLYLLLLRTAFASAAEIGGAAGTNIKRAGIMLSWTWGVYPIVYCYPFLFDSAGWAVAAQLAFTVADISAKVGFGFFIHYAAKARTATDVSQGESPHPEASYSAGVKVAEAQPVELGRRTTYADQGATLGGDHATRPVPEHAGR